MELEQVLKCVEEEPELPGEPPENMKRAALEAKEKGDVHFFAECMRLAVRLTKQGIAARITRRWT